MADFAGFVIDASALPRGIDHYTGFPIDAQPRPFGIDHYIGDPIRTLSLWWTDRDGVAQITLGAATLASAGTAGEFQPSRERITHVPSWPRVLLAENPDRVIELYRPPRTVRTAA